MYKDVVATIPIDEAISFCVIEPFDGSSFFFSHFFIVLRYTMGSDLFCAKPMILFTIPDKNPDLTIALYISANFDANACKLAK